MKVGFYSAIFFSWCRMTMNRRALHPSDLGDVLEKGRKNGAVKTETHRKVEKSTLT
eukprot:UN06913